MRKPSFVPGILGLPRPRFSLDLRQSGYRKGHKVHTMRNAPFATFIALMAAGSLAQAQTVTLEDFDFGDSAVSAPIAKEADSGLAACLLDPGKCDKAGVSVGNALSIDDVVNLGIIDRSEVAAQPAAAGTTTTANPQATALPSIDIEIFFDYNAADIRADQYPRLNELAQTLAQPEFSGFTIAFIGHTDAKGSAAYNRDLSYRRARSVAAFVEGVAGVPAGRVTATGIGSDRLKTQNDPFSALNRRVQLVLIPRT
jgi:outer membrane protein OmpA-like peptidoglycan-associated protein